MYKRLYTFLNDNSVIYNLQFGFRQQYSISHALINITENIRKALDDENIGCGVFVDLQKTFDTVDHQILLAKLNHYGICGVSNDWFKSYLSNCNQYLFLNEYESDLAAINCDITQGSFLGLLLFLGGAPTSMCHFRPSGRPFVRPSICHAPYLQNRTSYNHNFCYTCVK